MGERQRLVLIERTLRGFHGLGGEATGCGGREVMKMRWLCVPLLLCSLFSGSASADNRVIVRTALQLQGLRQFCNPVLFVQTCTVVRGLGDPLNQLFLVTTPLDLTTFLNLLGNTVG